MEPAYKLLNVEEFLDACPNDQRHYQLFDGFIVAMAPPAIAHQVIAGRLSGEIYAALRSTRPECFVRPQAGIAPMGARGRDHFETDLTVSCAPLDRDVRGIVSEPLLIVEVLSPSTERDDVFVKLPAYQSIASLQEILYVETERIGATVYRRDGVGWAAIEAGAADRLTLDTVGLDIPLADLYRGIPGLPDPIE
ncbi:MAG TPA: Uma2 family endonuclease [Stellaceae bacterium]|jgi:Uma2 family endonuclease|nr:Uma2 family endonuclease [Stellaceae bacterium]